MRHHILFVVSTPHRASTYPSTRLFHTTHPSTTHTAPIPAIPSQPSRACSHLLRVDCSCRSFAPPVDARPWLAARLRYALHCTPLRCTAQHCTCDTRRSASHASCLSLPPSPLLSRVSSIAVLCPPIARPPLHRPRVEHFVASPLWLAADGAPLGSTALALSLLGHETFCVWCVASLLEAGCAVLSLARASHSSCRG